MRLTAFQKPELRDTDNSILQVGTYSVKNGVLANAQNTGVLDYINNNLQAHQNAIETLQTGALQTKIVTSLPNPSTADTNTVYMIKYTSGGEEYYYQYRLIDGSFVRVGDTKIDITELTSKVNTNTTNIATNTASISSLSNGKLNKAGDTMSGHLQFSTESTEIRKTTNVGYLILRGGTTYNDSANVLIYGNDNTNNAGQVILRGGSGTVGIVINKDGTTSVNTPTTTDTLTLDSTYATAHSAGQNCHWYRIGKIVRICLDVDVTGCTTLKTIGTLPYNAGSYTVLNIHNFSSDTQGAETAFVNDRLLRIKVPANARYIITGFYMAQ